MAKATVQITFEDMERLFGKDPEFNAKLARSALQGYAEKYIKPVMNNPSVQGDLKKVLDEMRQAMRNTYITQEAGQNILAPAAKTITDKMIEQACANAESRVARAATSAARVVLREELDDWLRSEISLRVDRLTNEYIEKLIAKRVAKMYEASKENKNDTL